MFLQESKDMFSLLQSCNWNFLCCQSFGEKLENCWACSWISHERSHDHYKLFSALARDGDMAWFMRVAGIHLKLCPLQGQTEAAAAGQEETADEEWLQRLFWLQRCRGRGGQVNQDQIFIHHIISHIVVR